MIPGQYFVDAPTEMRALNVGRATTHVLISNLGDRPIQVGSHFHMFEVNNQLAFERQLAYGMRLNIAAGTSVRFEPGEEKEVELVAFGGLRHVYGHTAAVNGALKENDATSGEDGATA